MPYFARINKKTNIVEEVISSTQLGIFEKHDFEDWIQTSYNGNMRENYAGIGYVYDKVRDAFIPPKPYDSWVLNTETAEWESPIGPAPELTEAERETLSYYQWDEENTQWNLVTPE